MDRKLEARGISMRRLRALPLHASTRVIIMSTKDYDQDREMARELGAVEYLVKPVRPQQIREVITKYTGVRYSSAVTDDGQA